MTYRNSPVTDDELHAYVDGELPADRRDAVTAWLSAHPDQAALVIAWRAQADAIRARYGAVANEPVPDRLELDRVMLLGRTGVSRSWKAMAAAAAVAAFLAGGTAGWVAHGATTSAPSSFDTITADALDAYRLYVVEVRHPVEVPGNERPHMTQWLTKRLGYQQHIPDLESLGLKLVGGRLLPGPTGAAAFYMYEGALGERFTIYSALATSPETALRYKEGDRFSAFYWVDDKHAYVVSGPADRDRLRQITRAAWEQIDRSAGRKS
jgi:anti-sigma factor RsiW